MRTQQERAEELRLLEAMLFASAEPLDEKALAARLPQGVDVHAALLRLQEEYAPRGVNLVRINGKWTFRTASDLSWLLSKETVETRKLSRAAIETLAIIAYHQPVTRAEIEDIRGVTTSKGSVDVLLETGWIRPRGRRKAPGRPVTYGTNEAFLSHFGLDAVSDLPGLDELKGSGLLDGRLPPGFSVPMPSDDPALRDDEDPLEPGDLDLGLAPPPERVGRGVSQRLRSVWIARWTQVCADLRPGAFQGLERSGGTVGERMRPGEVLVFAACRRLVSRQPWTAGPCGPEGPCGPVAPEDLRMGSMSIWHWIIVLAVGLLLFGGRGKISELMGDFAKGIKSFKKGLSEDEKAEEPAKTDPVKTIDHQPSQATTGAPAASGAPAAAGTPETRKVG